MQPNPVTTDDLTARWRPLTDAEQSVASALLDDAWAILNTLAPAVSDLESDSPAEAVAKSLVCAAVLRVMRNPDGNKSESIDDYSFTRDASVAGGGLYYSDDELELVRGVEPKARSYTYANEVCP